MRLLILLALLTLLCFAALLSIHYAQTAAAAADAVSAQLLECREHLGTQELATIGCQAALLQCHGDQETSEDYR